MGSLSIEEWSDFIFGSEIRLPIFFFRHIEPHLHSLEQLLVILFRTHLIEAGEFGLSLLVELYSLRNVKSIRSKETIDLFLELGNILLVEGSLENFGRKHHHGLIEISVGFLIGQNLRFELHVRVNMTIIGANARMSENDPTVFVRHFLSFFI